MTIEVLNGTDKSKAMSLLRAVKKDLRRQGIGQWDRFYPNRFVVGGDIRRRNMYGIKQEGRLVAIVTLDTKMSDKYGALEWQDAHGHPACVHRLAVHPECQGKGLGKQLLRFAEELAGRKGHSSIRLDVYADNPGAVRMYERAGYRQAGEIRYPMRKAAYLCLEKLLRTDDVTERNDAQ